MHFNGWLQLVVIGSGHFLNYRDVFRIFWEMVKLITILGYGCKGNILEMCLCQRPMYSRAGLQWQAKICLVGQLGMGISRNLIMIDMYILVEVTRCSTWSFLLSADLIWSFWWEMTNAVCSFTPISRRNLWKRPRV